MTLIAAINVERVPFLLGDVLVSLPRRALTNLRVHSPTIRDINGLLRTDSEYVYSGLVQKLLLLSEKLAIGWSGSSIAARSAIAVLEESLSSASSAQDLCEVLKKFFRDDLGSLELSCVGAFQNSPVSAQIFGIGVREVTHSPVVALVAGSGTNDVTDHIQKLSRGFFHFGNPALDVLNLAALCLGLQIQVGRGVTSHYGGAFEIVRGIEGVGFAKTGWTFVAMQIEREIDGWAFMPMTIMKMFYLNDILIVRQLGDGDGALQLNTFIIHPVNRTITELERTRLRERLEPLSLSFDSECSSLYVFLPQAPPTRQVHMLSHIKGQEGEPAVTVEMTDRCRLKFSPETTHYLSKLLFEASRSYDIKVG